MVIEVSHDQGPVILTEEPIGWMASILPGFVPLWVWTVQRQRRNRFSYIRFMAFNSGLNTVS